MHLTGTVSAISRGSLHDGDGIRTVVYFKGCPLRCKWCHNPETFSGVPDIMYAASKCIACGDCVDVCPACHKIKSGRIEFDRNECIGCGKCADICPAGALSVCGTRYSVTELFDEIMKDAHYFRESGGGVTLSGGECLLHSFFVSELLKKCRQAGVHTAIESSLSVPFESVEAVIPYVDLIFADLKHHSCEKHIEYTGSSNEHIVENIRRLSELHQNIIIRIPLIPGVNDSAHDMVKFGEIISTFHGGIKAVELLKYNYLARSKYESVGMDYTNFGTETQTQTLIGKLRQTLSDTLDGRIPIISQ